MLSSFLLDTNIIIDYLRENKDSALFLEKQKKPIISIITVAELYQGVKNKTELKKIKQLLKYFKILTIDENISLLAINLMEKYFLSSGLLILDAFIAATAINHKLILKTKNIKHFKMINELKIEIL